MSEEFGFTNVGDSGVQPIKVEKKEPTLSKMSDDRVKELAAAEDAVPEITVVSPTLRSELEKEVDAEIIAKGADAVNDFDASQAIVVTPKKKRRAAKKEAELVPVSFPCKSCGEMITDRNVMKIGAGTDRYAVFCPFCQRSLGFIDEVFQQKVLDLATNNPTGKDEKKASA